MSLFQKNPEQMQRESENRQMNYGREQTFLGAATDAREEQTYMDEQERRSDLLKWQQDLDDELRYLVMTLLGFSLENDKWVELPNMQMCNDTFIHEVVIPQCRPYMSRNMINSNFDEPRLLDSLKNTSNDIADAMSDNFDRYKIKFQNYDLVVRMIKNAMKASAFRALNGWTKRMDSTVFKSIEANTVSNVQGDKKKILGIF